MKQVIKRHLGAEAVGFIRKWGGLMVLSLALAIIIIDTTLLNVSLGVIIRELNTNIQSLQWVITAYALTLAALTITGGRLGDLYGRKKMFMLGAIIFAIGSFTASISHSVGVLLIGESIIEGVGAALMMPATASLLLANFHGKDRAIAFGIWGGVAGAASAIGPILGGWLTSAYSWRWGFRINVVIAALLVVGAVALIRESRDTQERPTLDWGGVLLSATGLFALVFGIIESSTYGWWHAKAVFELAGHLYAMPAALSVTPLALAVGVALLGLFVAWESRMQKLHKTPLVNLAIFRNKQFVSGMVTLAIVSLGLTGLIFVFPIFFQGVKGLDALHTGTSLLPLSISLFFAAPLSILLLKRFTAKRIIQVGLAISVVAVLVIRLSVSVSAGVGALAPGLMLFGIGMGFVMAQVNNLTLSAVSVEQGGEASGVNNTGRQIGSALGSAIIGAVLLAAISTNLVSGVRTSQVIPESAKARVTDFVTSQSSNIEFNGGAQSSATIPPRVATEIKTISDRATVDALKYGLDFVFGFVLLSLLVSAWLPNMKDVETSKSVAGH